MSASGRTFCAKQLEVALCFSSQAKDEHSKASVFPVPVGDSKRPNFFSSRQAITFSI